MQDQYSGMAGTFIVDGEAGIRVPADDWVLYLHDKAAYLADREAALLAFKSINLSNADADETPAVVIKQQTKGADDGTSK